jgi:hypothetical protein
MGGRIIAIKCTVVVKYSDLVRIFVKKIIEWIRMANNWKQELLRKLGFSNIQRIIITISIAVIAGIILIVGVVGGFARWFEIFSHVESIKKDITTIKQDMVTEDDIKDLATKKDFEYLAAMRVTTVSPDKSFSITSKYPRLITVKGTAGTVPETTDFFIDQRNTFKPAPLPPGHKLFGSFVLGPPTVNLQKNVKVTVDLALNDLQLLDADLKNFEIYRWNLSGWEPVNDVQLFLYKKSAQFNTKKVGYYALVAKIEKK